MSAPASAPPADAAAVQRIGLKVFLDDDAVLSPRDVIPVFHRWIQTRAVDGLLIDVVDYTHLPTGPLVLLVGHEGRYVLDRGDDRLGLQYVQTQPLAGPLETRLRTVAGMLVRAARRLESDATLPGPIRFRGDEIDWVANDRLLAPNTPDTLSAVRPAFEAFLRTLSDGAPWTLTPRTGPGTRFGIHARTTDGAPFAALAGHLDAGTGSQERRAGSLDR